jgi:hypothetical protein
MPRLLFIENELPLVRATRVAERWFSVKVRTVVPARSIRAKDWRDPRCCCDDRDIILDSESHRGAQRRRGGFSN